MSHSQSSAPAPILKSCSRVRPRGGIPAQVLAFVAAMNDCVAGSALPHPAHARNVRLVPAWRSWLAATAAGAPQAFAEDLFTTARRTVEQNVDLLRSLLRSDPVLLSGCLASNCPWEDERDTTIPMAVAALMFWLRPHTLLETTAPLETLLTNCDLGSELPMSLVRPPFPACYLAFGKTFAQTVPLALAHSQRGAGEVQGVYVLESVRELSRALTIIVISRCRETGAYGAGTIEFFVNDEQRSLDESIRAACREASCDDADCAHFESVARIVAKVLLYMRVEQAVQVVEPRYAAAQQQLARLGSKKAARLLRKLPELYDRIVLGPRTLPAGAGGELSPHLRRGHFRLQPHGPQAALRKVIFIAPTWVRADKLAA